MRLRLSCAACGMLALSLGGPSHAYNCYQIWDARDNLVYQSTQPPFDLARPAFDRAMANLRSRGQTFIFFDTLDCAIAGSSLTGPASAASSDPSSILDIRSYFGAGYGRSSGGMLSPTPASTGVAAPAGPPPGNNARPSGGSGMGTSGTSVRY